MLFFRNSSSSSNEWLNKFVIAYITIKLDDKSSESLQHLEFVNIQMDKLEGTLEEANEKVTGFTADLDEAKDVFRKVGVDLTQLDLDSVADVVEKLKENREGLGEVLDNLKKVDVSGYIDQAKRIDWKQLLGLQRNNGLYTGK